MGDLIGWGVGTEIFRELTQTTTTMATRTSFLGVAAVVAQAPLIRDWRAADAKDRQKCFKIDALKKLDHSRRGSQLYSRRSEYELAEDPT